MSLLENNNNSQLSVKPPKVLIGNTIMLTLTPDNRRQYISVKPTTRLNKMNEDIGNILKMFTCFKTYHGYREVSEPLSSEGSKFYPRLHYHFVCKVSDPIKMYLNLGYISEALGHGYHITLCDTKEKVDHYFEYIIKQQPLWKKSKYISKMYAGPERE